jgi:hypothetical protein
MPHAACGHSTLHTRRTVSTTEPGYTEKKIISEAKMPSFHLIKNAIIRHGDNSYYFAWRAKEHYKTRRRCVLCRRLVNLHQYYTICLMGAYVCTYPNSYTVEGVVRMQESRPRSQSKGSLRLKRE